MTQSESQNLPSGFTLDHYRILDKLGFGGMGQVYLAQDIRLERRVAIKVLSADMAQNPDRMLRFIQEAKAASALNHPHIAHIYEVGESNGINFIAMEYVEGTTLRDKIHRERASLRSLLKYLVQVADGLAKAHAAGIVHRDLKPDNIIVSRDGYAKILDFGLAKLVDPLAPLGGSLSEAATAFMEQRPLSTPGTIMGTAGYMSPEQARGLAELDQRSDIFSFGCILYEAATGGQQAFAGDSMIDSLHKIIYAQPAPIAQFNPSAPAELQRIVRRCLKKDPEERYQTIKDAAIELRELRREMKDTNGEPSFPPASVNSNPRITVAGHTPVSADTNVITSSSDAAFRDDSGTEKLPPRRLTGRSRAFVASLAGLAVIAGLIGLFGLYKYFGPSGQRVNDISFKVMPLTSSPTVERNPALSPDGKQVAYAWTGEKGDNFDIYVKITDAGSPLRLTANPAKDMSPTWSPDGRFVAFLRGFGPEKGFYIVPALGGAERKIADTFGWNEPGSRAEALDWSPDGKTLAVVDKAADGEPWSIFLISVETGEKRKLTTPPTDFDGDTIVAFSPDGERVGFLRRRDGTASDIYTVPVSGGEPARVTTDNVAIRGLDWTGDGDSLVFSSERGGGNLTLWRIPSSGGTPEPVAGTGENVTELSISPQGNRLVYARLSTDTNLWRVEVPGRVAGRPLASPTKLVASNRAEGDPQYSPNGQRIAFFSDRSGTFEIWVCDSEGQNAVQLTTFGGSVITGSPRWSPDGRTIAFDSRTGGNADVYVVSADGGVPRRITSDQTDDAVPSWSRDGRFIYFASKRTGRFEIWKAPVQGGDAIQITHGGAFISSESADGSILYFTRSRPEPSLWSVSTSGGEESKVLDLNLGRNWAVGQQGIYYFSLPPTEFDPYTLEYFDFATRKTTRIATVPGSSRSLFINVITLSPDERSIVYSQRDQLDYDLMLVEGFR